LSLNQPNDQIHLPFFIYFFYLKLLQPPCRAAHLLERYVGVLGGLDNPRITSSPVVLLLNGSSREAFTGLLGEERASNRSRQPTDRPHHLDLLHSVYRPCAARATYPLLVCDRNLRQQLARARTLRSQADRNAA
jgi:hypothetical protein